MPFEKGKIPEGATPFKPGETGNPNGRPKKLPKLDELLSEILGAEEDKDSEAYAILERLVKDAKGGNTKAAEIILDRAYGKSQQFIDHTTKGQSINGKDLSKLSDEELRIMAEIEKKLNA